MTPLDPIATRKPAAAGAPFTLADGQTWHLATPRKYFKPRISEGAENQRPLIELVERWDFPRSARDKVQEMLDAVCSGVATFPLAKVVDPAVELVMLCHDLTYEQAFNLFDMTCEEVEDLAVGLLRMFRGERPDGKPDEPESPEKGE
jgi:hypothetical protein